MKFLNRFFEWQFGVWLEPDTGASTSGGGDPSAAAVTASAASVASSEPSPPVSRPSPATTSPASSQTPSSASVTQPQTSLRDVLRSLGYQSEAQNDLEAIQQVVQQATAARRIAGDPSFQLFQQNQDKFLSWHQEQQRLAEEAKAKQQQWWSPPPWNPENERFLAVDSNGRITGVVPGADPSLVKQYMDHQSYQRDFASKFLKDPAKALEGYKEQILRESDQRFEQRLGVLRSQASAGQIFNANKSWMLTEDGRSFTDAGRLYFEEVKFLAGQGINDPVLQDKYARQTVQNKLFQLALQNNQQPVQSQAQSKSNTDFLANSGARVPNNNGQAAIAAQTDEGLSIEEKLRRDFDAAGITVIDASTLNY